jgi:hypothetical protein
LSLEKNPRDYRYYHYYKHENFEIEYDISKQVFMVAYEGFIVFISVYDYEFNNPHKLSLINLATPKIAKMKEAYERL